MIRRHRFDLGLVVAIGLILVFSSMSLAARGGKERATGSFDLVLLDPTDEVANYGEDVTFEVTSNAYHPTVRLTCYQGPDWVTNQTVGFYDGWPWSQVFPLRSWKWPGGAADCDGVLYYTDHRGRAVTLASLSFHVYE